MEILNEKPPPDIEEPASNNILDSGNLGCASVVLFRQVFGGTARGSLIYCLCDNLYNRCLSNSNPTS